MRVSPRVLLTCSHFLTGSVLSSASNRPTPPLAAYRGSSSSAATPVTANSRFGARSNNVQRSNFRQNSAPSMAAAAGAGGGARRPSKLPKPVSTPGKTETIKHNHISVV